MAQYHDKARAIVRVLRPEATAEQVRALTGRQWKDLAQRAGVGDPSPLTRRAVLDAIDERDAEEAGS